MAYLDRFGVSMDTELLAAFDGYLAGQGYANRSEALRDLVRAQLTGAQVRLGDATVAGVLTLLCHPEEADAAGRIRACLTERAELVAGTLHLPLANGQELQVLVLRGRGEEVEGIAHRLQALRGVTHAQLSLVPLDEQDAVTSKPDR